MAAAFIITGTITKISELRNAGKHTCIDITIPEDKYIGDETVTAWHKITLWNKNAEKAHKFLAPGSVIEATCDVSYRKDANGAFYTNFNARTVTYHAFYGKNKKQKAA